MDKARHPHVMRTWRVERTKVPYRPPQAAKLPSHPLFTAPRRPDQIPHQPPTVPDRET